MSFVLEFIWFKTWWSFEPSNLNAHSQFTHWFNLMEGGVWFGCAGLVLRRYGRFRRSAVELAYAAAFVLFGFTDVLEAYHLTSWLIWVKLALLFNLFRLRRHVMKHFYPESKVL